MHYVTGPVKTDVIAFSISHVSGVISSKYVGYLLQI